MRDTADLYEVDLVEDLDINVVRLERMFIVELEAMVDEGELKQDDLSALEEVCESLHIAEARAQALLSDIVGKRVSGGMLQAAMNMRQQENAPMVKELENALKFAAIVPEPPVAKMPSVSAAEKSELVMLYQAASLSEGAAPDEAAAKLELLKSVIGLESQP